MNPAVVILAAGASARLGECKALVDLGGKSALARLIAAASSAGAGEIAVISGAHRREIEGELERADPGRRVRHVFHAGWARGRTSSAALAAAVLPERALLFAPIDVPLVGREVFASLFEAWEQAEDPPRGWLAPCVEPGPRYGHPIVLGRALAAELRGIAADVPLSELRSRAEPVWAVRVGDEAILDDLDTVEDLKKLRGRVLHS